MSSFHYDTGTEDSHNNRCRCPFSGQFLFTITLLQKHFHPQALKKKTCKCTSVLQWLTINFLMDCFCLKHNTLINVNHKSGSVCNALQIASMKSSLHIVTNSWACFRKWPEGKRWSWDAFQLIKAAKSFLASIKQQFGILTSPYWISPTAVQTFFLLCHRRLCS